MNNAILSLDGNLIGIKIMEYSMFKIAGINETDEEKLVEWKSGTFAASSELYKLPSVINLQKRFVRKSNIHQD